VTRSAQENVRGGGGEIKNIAMSFWDDIDSLRQLSLWLMWGAGLLAIAAAGATLLRYYVDQRASELSFQAQLSREEENRQRLQVTEEENRQRQQAAESELKKLRDRDEENRKRHELAEKELTDLRLKSAPRSLSPDGRRIISEFLTNKPKGTVAIAASVNASDAGKYADEIWAVLRGCRMEGEIFERDVHWSRYRGFVDYSQGPEEGTCGGRGAAERAEGSRY